MPLFDAYIFVDWSAAHGIQPQKPTADAVWTGEFVPEINFRAEKYHRLRKGGISYLTNVLRKHVRKKNRVLLGFDFPYGYPAGFAAALGLDSGDEAWRQTWAEMADRVEDTDDNKNNRFKAAGELNALLGDGRAGPFWGCPLRHATDLLKRCSPGFPFRARGGLELPKFRLVETRLPGTREVWGLYGPGRAGSQALVGIPYLYKLRFHPEFVRFSQVWPFETFFTQIPPGQAGPFIMHAEIWPGVVKERVRVLMETNPEIIRDEAQVRAMCLWAAEMDQQNLLGNLFLQPGGASPREIRACVQEEGWILGAK